MRFSRLKLENWRNFLDVDVPLRRRMFVIGPNASGKSNLLDAFRFLRDIANPRGGLQQAVELRQGVSQIRSLHARARPGVAIDVEVELTDGTPWRYRLEFTQDNKRRAVVRREEVRHGATVVLQRPTNRPDDPDRQDPNRLTQTHLEQVNANQDFRPLQEFLAGVQYLHIVPQLIRQPHRWESRADDPYGGNFLKHLAGTPKRTRDRRLRRIGNALKVAVPQLKDLKLDVDEGGAPHLKGLYEHWRPNAGWQSEDQFSDGTLRLFGLLWIFVDGRSPLLLEEPELSLHRGIVRHIPSMMARIARSLDRQVLVSTHSADLLADEGIAGEEILLLTPTVEDTKVTVATDDIQVRRLLEAGMPVGEAVIPRTSPRSAHQLTMFGD